MTKEAIHVAVISLIWLATLAIAAILISIALILLVRAALRLLMG